MGLASVAGTFPEFREADRWRTVALERMWSAMGRQVLPDGVHGELDYRTLVEWILEDRLPVRFQAQIHKHIWDPAKRGV